MIFEFKMLHGNFPKMWQCQNNGFSNVRVFESPFCNRQTFTIGTASAIYRLDDDDVLSFVSKVIQITGRYQMVIDVNQEISHGIIEKLRPHCSGEIVSTPYVSTNKSKMVMHIIQFKSKFLD